MSDDEASCACRRAFVHRQNFMYVKAYLSENVRKQFVPFFRDQAQADAEISETREKIGEKWPELCRGEG